MDPIKTTEETQQTQAQIPESTGKEPDIVRDEKGKFTKGHSANPNGRPKGKKDYATEMNEAIEEYAKINGLTANDVKIRIYMKGASEALQGDYNFFKDYMDRVHGRPVQPTTVEQNVNLVTVNERVAEIFNDK